MTFKEATETAMRELGYPDSSIKKAILTANSVVPGARPSVNRDSIKPGQERETIDFIKALISDPELAEAVLGGSRETIEDLEKNN